MSSESARISVKRTTLDLIVPIAESMGITVTEYINNVLLDDVEQAKIRNGRVDVARIRMPISLSLFGNVLDIFNERYPGATTAQVGEELIIYTPLPSNFNESEKVIDG